MKACLELSAEAGSGSQPVQHSQQMYNDSCLVIMSSEDKAHIHADGLLQANIGRGATHAGLKLHDWMCV